jgi:hypothetical protein
MDQHPIPRQITTFEFKLVGFMTLKQFGYVILGGIFGYGSFLIVQIPVLNFIVGIAVFCVGAAFAFFPINERPLDVFIKNLFIRLVSPTQYVFMKHGEQSALFDDLYFEDNPHIKLSHVESKARLAKYMSQNNNMVNQASIAGSVQRPKRLSWVIKFADESTSKNSVNTSPPSSINSQIGKIPLEKEGVVKTNKALTQKPSDQIPHKDAFVSGAVMNQKKIPLPGVLIYLKDVVTDKTLRILKTNPHGIFASFHPLDTGTYRAVVVDPSNNYAFDPVLVDLSGNGGNGLEFKSKEVV